ncbi:hypothetical protein RHO12_03085 [Orbus sturtevantii]|uniref:hypothetical protein n=1 Tax=Orbus sturtevantii TaxID=3074109 RepID=UPI00370D535A
MIIKSQRLMSLSVLLPGILYILALYLYQTFLNKKLDASSFFAIPFFASVIITGILAFFVFKKDNDTYFKMIGYLLLASFLCFAFVYVDLWNLEQVGSYTLWDVISDDRLISQYSKIAFLSALLILSPFILSMMAQAHY